MTKVTGHPAGYCPLHEKAAGKKPAAEVNLADRFTADQKSYCTMKRTERGAWNDNGCR